MGATWLRVAAVVIFLAVWVLPFIITELVEPVPYYPPAIEFNQDELRWDQLVC
jgi:hypothetical protein